MKEFIVDRELAYQGGYLKVDRLQVDQPNGVAIREIVSVRDATAILPLDADGNVHMVRQFRPAIDKTIIEIPAGLIDKGESAEDCAMRECEEETGWLPRKLVKLITYAHAEGYSTGFTTLFFASRLVNTRKVKLDETECLEEVVVPFELLMRMVKHNEIIDSKTILATMMVAEILK